MEAKLSIIVPVYRVEAYLRPCVDSILAQTFPDYELILVDDGSPDACGRICDGYAAADGRVKVIHKENGGLMSAWKTGFAAADAPYTGFVDSDDWIDPDMFERLYREAVRCDADIVCCQYIYEADGRSVPEHRDVSPGVYDRAAIERELYPRLLGDETFGRQISPNRWTKLYRSGLIRDNLACCPEDISYGEDMHLFFSAMCDAARVCIIPDFHPYHYRQNSDSITGKYNPRYWENACRLNRNLRAISDRKGVYDFRPQLERDLISMAVESAALNEFRSGAGGREIRARLRALCAAPELREAFARSNLSGYTGRRRLLAELIKRRKIWALYGVGKADRFRKRRHRRFPMGGSL